MWRRAFQAAAVAVLLATPVAVQAQGDYIDVYTVKVRPEKVADFQVLARKWADANRRNSGDHWLAMETVYGEGNVFVFVSTRQDYADIDKANEASMSAADKAFGKDAEKMLHDWDSCLVWSRNELRHRRWDLSRKAPTDAGEFAKLLGESRFVRTIAVHVRPGRTTEFEALLKELKTAGEQNPSTAPLLVSQSVEGGNGTTFYVSTLRNSMAQFDKNPTLHEILGEEGYKKFMQVNAESVEGSESALYHFSPEISNPPEAIAAVASDFWQPKATMVAAETMHKPRAGVKTAAQKPKE